MIRFEATDLPTRPNERGAKGERGTRSVRLEELPADDPRGVRFLIRIDHPAIVMHTGGSTGRSESEQQPEIYGVQDEQGARARFCSYVRALGGTVLPAWEPITPEAGGLTAAEVSAVVQNAVGPLLDRIAVLEGKKK